MSSECVCEHENGDWCGICLAQDPQMIAYSQSAESKRNRHWLYIALAEFRFGFFIQRMELL